jgi:subtilase family serine protease
MKQCYTRFIWAGASVFVLGIGVTFCRGQGDSVLVLRPDLMVYSISAPSSASRGTSISVSDVTTNVGNASAVQSVSDIYICTNVNYVTASDKVANHAVSLLGVGKSWAWSGSVTVPATQTLGTNYYVVVANGNKQVLESNYVNNTNYVTIIINP